ncbi:MAG: formylmethanofuran dehydrogenase subunit A [Thiotrichales bacterium]
MLMRFQGGRIFDPAQGIDGEVRDLYVRDGRFVAPPRDDERIDRTWDLDGLIVMAGAIDLHTHIGGGKVNIARTLMSAEHRAHVHPAHAGLRGGSGVTSPSTFSTGYRYAELGYTACFEPAVLPSNARQAHMEMADTPMLDTGGYAMLGNDDLLLRMLARGEPQARINDYVAWTLHATQCIGIKVVNPGGISAFKFNQRSLDVDEPNRHFGITPRAVVATLSRALHELGVPHPLHVHASNLGIPGNFASTLATMDASEGHRLHLTHIQFHSYGVEGERKFSSAAEPIAAAVNRRPNISIDVGQILFGQTVTASGDTMCQYANHRHAHPNKWVCMDIECDAGCGVVPFRYRDKDFVNALQWAIGLELFLRVDDPWRVFLTTDHPNGAPFTSYPHLIRLLMDRGFRNERLGRIHPDAAAHSQLARLDREYTLYEIAIMTRAGPARVLGLQDRGRLSPGAVADLVAYRPHADVEAMFATPAYVFKSGELLVESGRIQQVVGGRTQVVRPEFDPGFEAWLRPEFERSSTVRFDNVPISDDEMATDIGSAVEIQPCGPRIA